MNNKKEEPVLNTIIEGLIKAGYKEEEAEALIAKLLEQEAKGFIETVELFKDKK